MPLVEAALARLAEELKLDPKGRGYPKQFPYSRSDVAVAHQLLMEPVTEETTRSPISVWRLKQQLILTGAWMKVEAASVAHVDASVRILCRTVLGYLNDLRADTLDLDQPVVSSILDSLVSAHVLSSADREMISSLANFSVGIPYCKAQLGLSDITMEDVEAASAL